MGGGGYAAHYNPRMKKDWTTRLIHSDVRVPFTLSFIVFGGATAEAMVLSLTESVQNGAVIPPGSPLSWKPLLLLVRALCTLRTAAGQVKPLSIAGNAGNTTRQPERRSLSGDPCPVHGSAPVDWNRSVTPESLDLHSGKQARPKLDE